MKREDIERIFDGATKEQIDSVLNINSADIGNAKKDYDELKTKYDKLGVDYNELKGKADKGGDLQAQIDTLNKTVSDKDNEIKSLKFNSALELKLAKSGAKSEKALKGLLDMDKITMGENGLEGFDEQLEQIKSENDYLFSPTGAGGMKHDEPASSVDGVEKAFLAKNPELKID